MYTTTIESLKRYTPARLQGMLKNCCQGGNSSLADTITKVLEVKENGAKRIIIIDVDKEAQPEDVADDLSQLDNFPFTKIKTDRRNHQVEVTFPLSEPLDIKEIEHLPGVLEIQVSEF